MNKQELIKKYEKKYSGVSVSFGVAVLLSEIQKDLKQLEEPQPIKLKDIIARMEGLSGYTRSEWLDEILHKFDSDYGILKYKDGYEQGKIEASMIPYEEPQKVTVPQFVADWIEYCKEHNFTLFGYLDPANGFESLAGETFEGDVRKCIRWCRKESNNFARAWLDGYEVDKEKQYTVKLKNTDDYLVKTAANGYRFYNNIYTQSRKHTKEEIEKSGFGWVFDCPGIEIEEVEE